VHSLDQSTRGPQPLASPFALSDLNAALALAANTAPGPDHVNALLLAHSPEKFRHCLLFLCNLSWASGCLPQSWRDADVCPIYKGHGAPANVPKSFRPISLTSCVVKTLERMIAARLVAYLEGRNFFSPWQAGFRAGYSTLDQIYRLIDRIQQGFNDHQYVSVAFLDIVAAFDTVWHDGLLYKLHCAGVRGIAWRWIRSFLSDRRFRVVAAGGEHSQQFSIGAGVPQGSILGPLLFLIFINDLPVLSMVKFAIFADDIAAWPVLNGEDGDRHLNHFLARLAAWAKQWHIVFSLPKSGHLCFHARGSRVPNPTPLTLGSDVLPRVQQYRYLGMVLTPTLDWRPHCNQVISRAFHAASRVASILTPDGPPPRVVRQLALALVVPTITYGFPLWRPSSNRLWAKLESAVCLPLRCALGLPPSTQRLALLIECGIIGPRLQFERAALAFAHRAHIKLAPRSQPSGSNRCFNYGMTHFHPTHSLFTRQFTQHLPRNTPKSRIPFGMAVRAISHFWGVDHTDKDCRSSRSLTKRALERQIAQIRSAASPPRYAQLDLSPWPADYLKLDDRQTAILRARLRLNRHHFRARQHRLGLEDSPDCTVCSVPETAHHVLFECVRFDLSRHACFSVLSFHNAQLASLSLLTGDFGYIRRKAVLEVENATARFLHTINRVRGI
jgi:hypothetical protein